MTKPEALPFTDAIKFWESKVPMDPKSFKELWNEQKVNAFAVSGVSNMDTVMDLYKSLGKAISEGQSFGAWKKQHTDLWEQKGWTGKSAWRVDNVFRTNVQTAFQIGRFKQMSQSFDVLPLLMYSAVSDSRTRPTHLALNGKVYRHDDQFWDSWYPPNGYRCRCTVRPLSESQAKRKGIEVQSGIPGLIEPVDPKTGRKMPARPLLPDPGFNFHPGKAHYQPDLSKYPATLKQRFLEKFLEHACHDDWMDFSESSCFVRLQRHLKQEDLEDMQALVWANSRIIQEDFKNWATSVLAHRQSKGEMYPVGNLPLKVLSLLEQQPRLALCVLTYEGLIHMTRSVKENGRKTLSVDEILQIPARFSAPDSEWFLDSQEPASLMCWQRVDDLWLKVVIKFDQHIDKKKKLIANRISTSGLVKKSNLNDSRYIRLR